MLTGATFIVVLILASIPVCIGRLEVLDRHLQVWKSFSGGVGVSYAFLVLLPKLAKAQTYLEVSADNGGFGIVAHEAYLVAVMGLVVYYGLDVATEHVRGGAVAQASSKERFLTYVHGCGVSGYLFLISFIMLEGNRFLQSGFPGLLLFGTAMAIHYVSVVHTLRAKYGELYDKYMGPTFAGVILLGWLLAFVVDIPTWLIALLYCFFAGSLTLFVLHEKMPGKIYFRFGPFLFGVVAYSTLLLLVDNLP